MKKTIKNLLALIAFATFCISTAQVGINTTDPKESLHINGTVRVQVTDQPTVITTKLFGLDSDGTLREVKVGTNLILASNVLYAKSAFDHSFGAITLVTKTNNHNIDLLLDPGEINFGKSIIRIFNIEDTTEITGFTGGYDGQHIWLYAQDTKIKLMENNVNSIALNQIEKNAKMGCNQYEMIELVYDGTREKWIVMQHHE